MRVVLMQPHKYHINCYISNAYNKKNQCGKYIHLETYKNCSGNLSFPLSRKNLYGCVLKVGILHFLYNLPFIGNYDSVSKSGLWLVPIKYISNALMLKVVHENLSDVLQKEINDGLIQRLYNTSHDMIVASGMKVFKRQYV